MLCRLNQSLTRIHQVSLCQFEGLPILQLKVYAQLHWCLIFFLQEECIAKLESLGFRIGQSLVER